MATVEVYRIKDYPLRALLLQAPSVGALARAGSRCVDALIERDVPHSLLMNGEQLFVVPRKKFGRGKALPFAVSPGFPEASGVLLVMSAEDFEDPARLNADMVWRLWREELSLEEEGFEDVLSVCLAAVI